MMNKKIVSSVLGGTLLIANTCWALALEIIPQGNLPAGIVPGETLYAYYNIQNNTGKTQTVLVDLPNGVEQLTTSSQYDNLTPCEQAPFTITTSCVLKLQVTAPVTANQEITVCLDDGATCTHTSSHDNNALVVNEKTTQNLFTFDASTGDVYSCLLSTDGFSLSECSTTQTFLNPQDVIINTNTNPPTAYVANSRSQSGGAYIAVCNVLNEDTVWNLENCRPFYDESIIATAVGLQLSPDGKRLYVTTPLATGKLGKALSKKENSFDHEYSVQALATRVPNTIVFCNINTDGTLSSPCTVSLEEVERPQSIWVTGAWAYLADNGLVSVCSIDSIDNTLALCEDSDRFSDAQDVITNNAGTMAYVAYSSTNQTAGGDNGVAFCSISPANGNLSNCVSIPVLQYDFEYGGLQISPDGNWLYITDYNDINIVVCAIANDGSLSICDSALTGNNPFSGPKGRIAFMKGDTEDYYAYIADYTAQAVVYCDYSPSDGALCSKENGQFFVFTDYYPLSVATDGTDIYVSTLFYSGGLGPPNIPYFYECAASSPQSGSCQEIIDASSSFAFGPICNFSVVTVDNAPQVYVPNGDTNTVSICPINTDDFTTTCNIWTALSPYGRVAFATFGGQNYLYVADYNTGNVIQCAVEADGSFSVCTELDTGIGNDEGGQGLRTKNI